MIIKTKSWKTRGYKRLYNYMQNGAENHKGYHFYSRNLYAGNKQQIINTFYQNSNLYKNRKNGIHLHHDIISITRSKKLSLEQQKSKLYDIVNQYCEKRCPNNLVVGFLHEDKKTDIHFHLMISANVYQATKKHSLTTNELENAKIQTELYCLEKHPELEQEKLISQKKAKYEKKTKISDGEHRVRQRGTCRKEAIKQQFQEMLRSSKTQAELNQKLSANNLEIKKRASKIRIIDLTGKPPTNTSRLDTLGVLDEYLNTLERFKNAKQEQSTHTHHERDEASKQQTQAKNEESEFAQGKNQNQASENTRAKNTWSTSAEEKIKASASEAIQPENKPTAEEERILKAKQELKKQRENRAKHQQSKTYDNTYKSKK